MMKFDMHCHTKGGSIDSSVSVERYIELLSAQGFDGMLITDHDSYKGYNRWLKSGRRDFCVLAGLEYDTKDAGHFLIIMPDNIRPSIFQLRGLPVEMLINIVHFFGGILGPAHPFGTRSSSAMFFKKLKRCPEIMQKVDFVEGFNTCEKCDSNFAAAELAEKLGKPCIGGSDAHDEAYVGMAYTLFDREISSNNDLIGAILDGGVASCGGREREYTRKAKMKDSLYGVLGFRAYNRSLGVLFAPCRKYRIKKLDILHHTHGGSGS